MGVSSVNSLSLDNIKSISGLSDTDIDTINSLEYNEMLLDVTPETPVVAFSLRRLSKDYTGNCIRIRETGGNTERDIGFIDGVVDTSAISTFCGSNSGHIVTIYDQSGNGNNATAPDNARQPVIYNSGSPVTLNGKPAFDLLDITSTNRSLNTSYNILNASTSAAYQFVVGCTNTGTLATFPKFMGPPAAFGINGGSASTNLRWNTISYGTTIFWGYPDATDIPQGQQFLATMEMLGASGAFRGYDNGSLIISATNGSGTLQASRVQVGGGAGRHHKVQEVIFYDSSVTSRTDIESNINSYYTIP